MHSGYVTYATQLCHVQEKCGKNQLNRQQVQFQQRTGSRSYIAQAYITVRKKKLSCHLVE